MDTPRIVALYQCIPHPWVPPGSSERQFVDGWLRTACWHTHYLAAKKKKKKKNTATQLWPLFSGLTGGGGGGPPAAWRV